MSRAEDREPLVPLKPGFDRVLGGFRKSQVRYYVEHAESEIQIITEDRDAALAQVDALVTRLESTMSDAAELRAQVDELTRAPVDTEALPHRLRRMVELAEQEAASIINRAHASSAREWHIAERMAGDLRARYEKQLADADLWHSEWDNQRRLIVEQAKIEADELAHAAALERKELDGHAEQRRVAIEADFASAMRAQRAELAAELAEERATAERECERRMLAATTESAQLVAAAKVEVAQLMATAKDEAARLVTAARDECEQRVAAATEEITRLYTDGAADAKELVTEAACTADRVLAAADDAATERVVEAERHLTTTQHNRRTLAEQVCAARQAVATADAVLDDEDHLNDAQNSNDAELADDDPRRAGHPDDPAPIGQRQAVLVGSPAESPAELGLPRPRTEVVSEPSAAHRPTQPR